MIFPHINDAYIVVSWVFIVISPPVIILRDMLASAPLAKDSEYHVINCTKSVYIQEANMFHQ